ncbi:Hypothetical protein P9303_05291 [Prochlorococcus marinus str. MIT 9303]|uniref:Uncharacterized protein n=1 Tax=Prochlorococcus marinus (strain MIT 9303) TaxID=59922 RepID=A2C721_PROM3|nr:Hypothetical protein P9303_05291 [Prochlorococcus marinus str. MIT 9303]
MAWFGWAWNDVYLSPSLNPSGSKYSQKYRSSFIHSCKISWRVEVLLRHALPCD